MKLRLTSLPDEVAAVAERLGTVFDVIEISRPYPCRNTGRNVRVYAEIRIR